MNENENRAYVEKMIADCGGGPHGVRMARNVLAVCLADDVADGEKITEGQLARYAIARQMDDDNLRARVL